MEAEKIVAQRKSEGKGALWTKLLQTYGRSEKEAITLLATTIGVKKFLDKKIETLTPEITDSETERYYRQNPGKYPGGDLESHRLQISADLKADRRQKALEDWVQSLKEKYKFANHLPDSIEPG